MRLIDLLGKKLKDEPVLQLLEDYEVGEIVYDFDRLHEGTEDQYWAESKAAGIALRFGQHQVLGTVFCYVSPIEGFTPVAPALVGVPLHFSVQEAVDAAEAGGVRCTVGPASAVTRGHQPSWVRHERLDAWVHYEFREGVLALVTLSMPGG